VTTEFGYALAFATGLSGAFHCLGMCSGIAGGYFVHRGWRGRFLPQLYYHGTRILTYTVLGVSGALVGRVLVQSGILGKGQGLLMIAAGVLITLVGLGLLGWLPRGWTGTPRPAPDNAILVDLELPGESQRWPAMIAGLVNGLVPCSLVFSVAVKAVGSFDPLQAGLLMGAFGLGTLPAMAAVSILGAVVGSRAQGVAARVAGFLVLALGLWTLYEGWVFYDVMRGLSN
jgi:sulfite exporter TauE/SafE